METGWGLPGEHSEDGRVPDMEVLFKPSLCIIPDISLPAGECSESYFVRSPSTNISDSTENRQNLMSAITPWVF